MALTRTRVATTTPGAGSSGQDANGNWLPTAAGGSQTTGQGMLSADKKYSSGGVWDQARGAYVAPGQSSADYAGWSKWIQDNGGWAAHGQAAPGSKDQGGGLTSYLGKAVRLATNPVNAGMDMLTGGKTKGWADPVGNLVNQGTSNIVGTDIDANLAGTGQYAPHTYGAQGGPATKMASPDPTATSAGGANLSGAGGASSTASTSPHVAGVQAAVDKADARSDKWFGEYETKKKALEDSGLLNKDQTSEDILMGKGTSHAGMTAAEYNLGKEQENLRGPSYAEQWFTGEGPQSLASVYDREGRKQNIAMQNRLSAMGKGNSGAAIRGGAELDAELSSKKALQMQGAAKDADASKQARLKTLFDASSGADMSNNYLVSGRTALNKADISRAATGLDLTKNMGRVFADLKEDSVKGETAGLNAVNDAKTQDINMLRDVANSTSGTLFKGADVNSAEGQKAAENELTAYYRSQGMDANAAAAKVKTVLAGVGGIGALVELIRGKGATSPTKDIGDDVMEPTEY
jgi:hypothetical protein